MISCVKHPEGDPFVMGTMEFIEIACGDHAGGMALGVYFGRWLRGEHLVLTPVMARAGMLGLFSVRPITLALARMVPIGVLARFETQPQEIARLLWKDAPNPPYEVMFCPWCKRVSNLLHKHHYPVPRRFRGTEIVEICAGCHIEFHHFEKFRAYSPTPATMDLFEFCKKKYGNPYGVRAA